MEINDWILFLLIQTVKLGQHAYGRQLHQFVLEKKNTDLKTAHVTVQWNQIMVEL